MADLPANRSRFELATDGVSAPLRVLRLSGDEALSQPFRFRLQLACEAPALDCAAIIDRNTLLTMQADGPARQVHGIVERFARGARRPRRRVPC